MRGGAVKDVSHGGREEGCDRASEHGQDGRDCDAQRPTGLGVSGALVYASLGHLAYRCFVVIEGSYLLPSVQVTLQ
jgi:hypothetical protein